MSRQKREQGIIKEHLANDQSTHGTGPQVSSGRLIRLLRNVYPEVGTQGLTGSTAALNNDPSIPAANLHLEQEAQASLISYLNVLIGDGAAVESKDYDVSADSAAAFKHTSTSGTLRLITEIEKLHEVGQISSPEFKLIAQQMRILAAACPGLNWNDRQTHWSSNVLYNAATGKTEQVLASPAETLNLLAYALLDESRYLNENEASMRIASFCSCLIDLARATQAVCSGGQQHELLFLLNRSYLDKPQSSQGVPIVLFESTSAFVMHAFADYLESFLNRAHPEDRVQLVLDGLRWEYGGGEVPLITYLKTQAMDGNWEILCREFLEQACARFGFCAASSEIQTKIKLYLQEDTLAAVPVPMGPVMVIPLLTVIFDSIPLISQSAVSSINLLWEQAWRLRETITPQLCLRHPEIIQDFARVVETLNSMAEDTRFGSVILDAQDRQLKGARDAVYEAAQVYLSSLELAPLSEVFHASKAEYLASREAYKKSKHVTFVANYFSLLSTVNRNEKEELMQRARSVAAEIPLRDVDLEAWYTEYSVSRRGEETMLSLSPYEINRILMHALFQPMDQWSPFFYQALQLVTCYLSHPNAEDDSIVLNTLKRSYPRYFLNNLSLMLLIQQSPSIPTWIKERCVSWLERDFLVSQSMLGDLLATEQLTAAHKSEILNVVGSKRLGGMIEKGYEFCNLFGLSLNKLTQAHRDEIFRSLGGQFDKIIENKEQLRALFELSTEHLSENHRTEILTGIGKEQLGQIIANGHQLRLLLKLSPEQLTQIHRDTIFQALSEQFGSMIENAEQFCNLLKLSLEQLTKVQRNVIFIGTIDHIGRKITCGDHLCALFQLSLEQFTQGQRNKMEHAVREQLDTIVVSYTQLQTLFALSTEQLSQAMRNLILKGWQGLFEQKIQNGYQLRLLFGLSLEQLTPIQRDEIFAAVKGQLGEMIQNATQFQLMFSLTPEQLTEAQRDEIFTAMIGQLGGMIQNGYQLRDLLSLSIAQLTQSQRSTILSSMKEGCYWIENGKQLCSLFKLPKEQLSEDQRNEMFRAVCRNLGRIIEDKHQLFDLFALSSEELTKNQRSMIWNAMKRRLGQMTLDANYISKLFQLSMEQVTPGQRNGILQVVKGQPDTIIKSEEEHEADLLAEVPRTMNQMSNKNNDSFYGPFIQYERKPPPLAESKSMEPMRFIR